MTFIQEKKNLNYFGILLCVIFSFFLVGCDSSLGQTIEIDEFILNYGGNNQLEEVNISSDDMPEISSLYQEVTDTDEYKDSLLVAEKYSRGMGVNTFVQDNLDVLDNQSIILKNIKKTQMSIVISGKKENMVLLEYEITEGFIPEVPRLYVSELFIPLDSNIKLFSFITESSTARNSASKMFKNIKIK